MAAEPRDLLQRLILDLRKRLDKIDAKLKVLDRMEKKIDDLAYLTNNALGFAAAHHLRLERLDHDLDDIKTRLRKLEERV
jgi:hypothetical protein